jgi:hypothetical protein
MRKLKIGFWTILLLFVGLVVFQNQEFFIHSKKSLIIKYFIGEYHTPEWTFGTYFLICFFAGLFISLFIALAGKIKTNKLIKSLKQTIDGQQEELVDLRKQVSTAQGARGYASQVHEPKGKPEESEVELVSEEKEKTETPGKQTPA